MPSRLPQNVRKFRDKFRAVVTINGKRVPGPLRLTPEEAEQDAAELRLQRRAKKSTDTTVQGGMDLVFEDLEKTGAREATVEYYRDVFRTLAKPEGWSPEFALSDITLGQVERYAKKRIAMGISTRTVWRKEIEALRRILRLARRKGLLSGNALEGLQPPKTRATRFGVIPRERVIEVIESMRGWGRGKGINGGRDADIVEVLFLTGLRRAELSRLRPRDLDFPTREIHVDGKTNGRVLPMTDRLVDLLEPIASVTSRDGSLFGGVKRIASVFRRWRRRLNEPLLAPHVLRHSFATAAVEAGVPQLVLAELLGHSDVRQTAVYYHGRSHVHREALEAVQGAQMPGSRARTAADTRRRWSSSRLSSESASRDENQSSTAD